jgi:hypothetical protein
MRVILFGATGMIGQGVLRECLLAPDVERVLTVVRTPTDQPLAVMDGTPYNFATREVNAMKLGPMLVLPLALAGACAPPLVAGSMTNPARSNEKLQSSQEYDIGPYKENHRYTITVADWTPKTLGVEIKLADIGECGKSQSYSFVLVDDGGNRYPLRPSGTPTETTEPGRENVTLNVSTFTGSFDAVIGPDARAITIQQRPQPNVGCPALDFRWTFDAGTATPQKSPS